MREINTHKASDLDNNLHIVVVDEPGQGGACHEYHITRKSVVIGEVSTTLVTLQQIHFQNGPIQEHGINGISNESLLAIVIDRLEGFQSGDFACKENQNALGHIKCAMTDLHMRTEHRIARSVEGTSCK